MAPADGCFRSFRIFRPKFCQRAFARFRTLSHAFARTHFHCTTAARRRAGFGAYLRSICVSEAEAWTYESSDCSLHPHGTIGSPECDRSHQSCENSFIHTSEPHTSPTEVLSQSYVRAVSGSFRGLSQFYGAHGRGCLLQFYGQNGCESAFAVLSLFRSFTPKTLSLSRTIPPGP